MEPKSRNVAPDLEQLALALTVVKSRPADLTIREYVLSLRRSVQLEGEQGSRHANRSSLDAAAYWKDKYSGAMAQQQRLEKKVRELELQSKRLSERLEQAPPEDPPLPKGRKRKLAAVPDAGGTKRPKTDDNEEGKSDVLALSLESSLESFSHRVDVTPLLHSARYLAACMQIDKLDPSRISSALLDVFSAADNGLSTWLAHLSSVAAQKPSTSKHKNDCPRWCTENKRDTETICSSISSILRYSMTCFGKLPVKGASGFKYGRVIYSCVKLYSSILEGVQTCCSLHIKTPPQRTRQGLMTTRSRTQQPGFQKSNDCLVMDLARVLLAMTTTSDPSKQQCREVLEGFNAVLLERIGSLLGTVVFTRATASEPGIHDAAYGTEYKTEAISLIWILEKIMMPSQHTRETRRHQSFGKDKLSEKVRQRFQQALLAGVFGAETEDFREALRVPEQPDDSQRMHSAPKATESVASWFEESVWRLIGWEVLSTTLNKIDSE